MTNSVRKWMLLGASGIVVVVTLGAAIAPDVPFAAGAGELCVAILALSSLILPITSSEGVRPKARVLVDGALVGVALWAIVYQLILVRSTVFVNGEVDVLGVISVPLALLGLGLVAVVIGRVEARFQLPLSLVAGGMFIAATVSVALCMQLQFAILVLAGVAFVGGVMTIAGLVLAALRLTETAQPASLRSDRYRRFSTVLPAVMVVAVLAMAIVLALVGRTITAIDYITGLVFMTLLVAQQVVANRERTALTEQLESRGALFQALVTGSAELITLHRRSGALQYASPAVYRLLGTNEPELIGSKLDEYIHPDDLSILRSAGVAIIGAQEPIECVVRVKAAGAPGESVAWRWMQTSLNNLLANPDVAGIVANTRDIHDEYELGQRLTHEAYHDALTGLGNLASARRIFAEHSYGKDRTPTALVLLDLDGFKTLNDTFGHAFGDDLLVAVARRLRRNVVDEDAIARIGGDEFVLIFESEREARQAARAIIDDLSRPLLVQGTNVIVHASMGIARSVDAKDSEELLRNADLAMYEAKAAGGDTFVSYDERMFERTAARMRIQEGLRSALDNDGFELVVQPIVDLRTRAVVGGEILLRWTDEDLGRVPPDVFIPVAESSGLIAQVDEWVLGQTCALIRRWRDAGLKVPSLSVNVSRRQITDGLDELISTALSRAGVEGPDLCVEITESAVVPDPDASARVLKAVRRLGANVALDDFGTGQSSLSQLAGLPVDRVKIDKSFVIPAATDVQAMKLLASIVGLCHSLRMPVVAEGVEDESTAQSLVAMGAQFGQGFYFYRPMTIEEFHDLIRGEVPQPRHQYEHELSVEDVLSAEQFEVISNEEPSRTDAGNQQ